LTVAIIARSDKISYDKSKIDATTAALTNCTSLGLLA
jgi:hypothetical protein